ncbi:MAG: twin-arginine translocation signal domain-containing protein [Balneolaceae bacterium]|nr:MAG: twin-arginine translocation signal domain-containing protein [Balneolaceae bacterium]
MNKKISTPGVLSRREFMKLSAATAAGVAVMPGLAYGDVAFPSPMKRRFGRTNFEVTTLGLGGQASIQWTPEDVDPVAIILKAFDLKVNYFDTSNIYGPSQANFGKAFGKRNLIPDQPGYDENLRSSFFLTTKTMIRWAKGGYPQMEGVRNATNGDPADGAVGDVKRALTLMFGDGEGGYPEGAYVDMVMIHNLTSFEEVDVVYRGLEGDLDPDGNFGALVALRDFRDGTNITGLNPRNEKLIRHIGFSGHYSAPAMMEMIQRDKYDLLDGMLVSINVNDRKYLNMQHNVIPVAKAKDIGVVGMKVFADGAMYDKEPRWSRRPEDVVRRVGTDHLPSKPLIEYVLTTPGVDTLIVGIGHIDGDPLKCQLIQNFYASQIAPDALSEQERRELEKLGDRSHDGNTNYFQLADQGLTAPRNIRITGDEKTRLQWDSAYAGSEPIVRYEVFEDGQLVKTVPHTPQISLEQPFECTLEQTGGKPLAVAAVDAAGVKKTSGDLVAG